MQDISYTYEINKDKKTGLPYVPLDMYLWSHIHKHPYNEDYRYSFCYDILGDHYVNNVIANIHKKLTDQGREFNY